MKYPYKTKNNLQKAKEITRYLINIFKDIPGVIGVSFGGGIGRKFFDYYSDVDMFVWVKDKTTKERIEKLYPKKDYSVKGYELDWWVVDYQFSAKQKVPSDFWNDQARLNFQLSLIVYDPQGLIEKLRKRVTFMSRKERKEIMEKEFDVMKWFINYTFEVWLKRGSLSHALQAYFSALNHFIYWLYAKNGKFMPWPEKWKFLWLEIGEIPETKYYKQISELYVVPRLSIGELVKKKSEFLNLLQELGLDLPAETAEDGKQYWKDRPEIKPIGTKKGGNKVGPRRT